MNAERLVSATRQKVLNSIFSQPCQEVIPRLREVTNIELKLLVRLVENRTPESCSPHSPERGVANFSRSSWLWGRPVQLSELSRSHNQIWVARLSKLGIFAPTSAYRSGTASSAQSVRLLPPQCISALRFPAWHAGGQEFESPWLHSKRAQSLTGSFNARFYAGLPALHLRS